jgi:hypothetical protein
MAKSLGVTPQHIGQAKRGRVGLSPLTVARAALLAGRDPLAELRACGHGELVDAIAQGVGAWETVSSEERSLLFYVRAAPPTVRVTLGAFVEAVARESSSEGRRPRRPPRAKR